jgi:hypothetical protein
MNEDAARLRMKRWAALRAGKWQERPGKSTKPRVWREVK